MLKIRKSQMDQMNHKAEDQFIQRMMTYLREKQSVWVEDCSDEKLRQRIVWGIARARSHGFTWESSLAKYVGLMFRFAPNFDEYPPIEEILNRKDVPGEERIDLVYSEISTEQWRSVTDRYDPAAWEFDE